MENGNELEQLLHQVADDAFYIDYDYPRMADRMIKLVKLVKVYDKNQKALINLVLRLQRANKGLDKMVRRMFHLMSPGQRDIIDVWLKEKDL